MLKNKLSLIKNFITESLDNNSKKNINESNELNTVRCNNCMNEYTEDELELMQDGENEVDKFFMNACPICKTDEYLMDINGWDGSEFVKEKTSGIQKEESGVGGMAGFNAPVSNGVQRRGNASSIMENNSNEIIFSCSKCGSEVLWNANRTNSKFPYAECQSCGETYNESEIQNFANINESKKQHVRIPDIKLKDFFEKYGYKFAIRDINDKLIEKDAKASKYLKDTDKVNIDDASEYKGKLGYEITSGKYNGEFLVARKNSNVNKAINQLSDKTKSGLNNETNIQSKSDNKYKMLSKKAKYKEGEENNSVQESYEQLKNTIRQQLILETGEPDQDYDIEFFNKLAESIFNSTGKHATHREFDKYQGVYLKVDGVGTFWIEEIYFTDTRSDSDTTYKYRKAYLIDDSGGRYSADRGDYWNMEEDFQFDEGTSLILVDMQGNETIINSPKKSDIPQENEIMPSTFSYKKNTETEHYIFALEQNPEVKIDVGYEPHSGELYDGDMIDYIQGVSNGIVENKSYNKLKNIIKENLLNESWVMKLHDIYNNSFEHFEGYNNSYGIANRLGYDDPEELWEDNPIVHGSTDPADFRVATIEDINSNNYVDDEIEQESQADYERYLNSDDPEDDINYREGIRDESTNPLSTIIDEELNAIKTADGKIITGEKINSAELNQVKQNVDVPNTSGMPPTTTPVSIPNGTSQTSQQQKSTATITNNNAMKNNNKQKPIINGKQTEIIQSGIDPLKEADSLVDEIYESFINKNDKNIIKEFYEDERREFFDDNRLNKYSFTAIQHLANNMTSEYANSAKTFIKELTSSMIAKRISQEMLYNGIIKAEAQSLMKTLQETLMNDADNIFEANIHDDYFVVNAGLNIKNAEGNSYDVVFQIAYAKSGQVKQMNTKSTLSKSSKIAKEDDFMKKFQDQSKTTKQFLNTFVEETYDELYKDETSNFLKGKENNDKVKELNKIVNKKNVNYKID